MLEHDDATEPELEIGDDDLVQLLYTNGTTVTTLNLTVLVLKAPRLPGRASTSRLARGDYIADAYRQISEIVDRSRPQRANVGVAVGAPR